MKDAAEHHQRTLPKPFLKGIRTIESKIDRGRYPFNIPVFAQGIELELQGAVTFFVGENGTGKSTLLEAIAERCGFNLEGGTRNHTYNSRKDSSILAPALRLSWFPKVTDGFFLRAESFFNFASYLERVAGDFRSYGGKSLHAQSHGESFLALFNNRFDRGIYLLDEPEAALSPQRQLTLLAIIHQLETTGLAQFIIATHSPMLLSYPGAVVLSFDGATIEPIDYRETAHFRLMKEFLDAPERYLKHLFSDNG